MTAPQPAEVALRDIPIDPDSAIDRWTRWSPATVAPGADPRQLHPMTRLVSLAARAGRWALDWTKSIAAALIVWFVLSSFVVKAFHVTSGSMERTLLVGDFLFVNKLLYGAEIPLTHRHLPALREPRAGEIIVVRSPIEDLILVKRLIGLPGDVVAMREGRLWRNGAPVAEPYVTLHATPPADDSATLARLRAWQLRYLVEGDTATYRPTLRTWGPLRVPADSLMAMGDNRDESFDSRTYGFIPRANVQGAPLFIYYSYDPASWRPLPALAAVRWGRLFHAP